MFRQSQAFYFSLLSISFSILHVKSHNSYALGELPDVAELQVGDEEEYDHHHSQSHVVLPQSPGAVRYPQVVQVLLSCTPKGRSSVIRRWGDESSVVCGRFLLTSVLLTSPCSRSSPQTSWRLGSEVPRRTSDPQTRWSSRPDCGQHWEVDAKKTKNAQNFDFFFFQVSPLTKNGNVCYCLPRYTLTEKNVLKTNFLTNFKSLFKYLIINKPGGQLSFFVLPTVVGRALSCRLTQGWALAKGRWTDGSVKRPQPEGRNGRNSSWLSVSLQMWTHLEWIPSSELRGP